MREAEATAGFYELSTPLIAVQDQPAVVLDHVASQEGDPCAVLSAAGLSPSLLQRPHTLLSPAQCLELLRQSALHLKSADTSFLLGQQMLPGHHGAASHALLRAPTLRSSLERLVAHPARLSPLLAPHFVEEARHGVLYWTDACGLASMRAFLVEMHMSALAAFCQWLHGARLPWQFCFNRTAPRHTEQHQVHLGSRLRFGCQLDAMIIPSEWLDAPWGGALKAASPAVLQGLSRQAHDEDARQSFLGALYQHLLQAMPLGMGLEATAQHFAMSPATFKRRLQAHGTHFQAELDQVRTHMALQLYLGRGQGSEQVAQQLGFRDAANFRRSIKRWTGLTPSSLRASLQPLQWA